ncbi:MAG: hypothetical protein ACJ8F7_23300 [Gemmataceae bacterium]
MSAPALPKPKTSWPADLVEFARTKGVKHQLDPLLELAHRLYPNAAITVALTHDPDEAGLACIQFEAKVPEATAEELFAARDDWDLERLQLFPGPDPGAFVFLLRRAQT